MYTVISTNTPGAYNNNNNNICLKSNIQTSSVDYPRTYTHWTITPMPNIVYVLEPMYTTHIIQKII